MGACCWDAVIPSSEIICILCPETDGTVSVQRSKFSEIQKASTILGHTMDTIWTQKIKKDLRFHASPHNYGAPERIRTFDLCLRRAALYPAELRAHSKPADRAISRSLWYVRPRGLSSPCGHFRLARFFCLCGAGLTFPLKWWHWWIEGFYGDTPGFPYSDRFLSGG